MKIKFLENVICFIIIVSVVLIDFLGFLIIAPLPGSLVILAILIALYFWGHPTWDDLKNWLKS